MDSSIDDFLTAAEEEPPADSSNGDDVQQASIVAQPAMDSASATAPTISDSSNDQKPQIEVAPERFAAAVTSQKTVPARTLPVADPSVATASDNGHPIGARVAGLLQQIASVAAEHKVCRCTIFFSQSPSMCKSLLVRLQNRVTAASGGAKRSSLSCRASFFARSRFSGHSDSVTGTKVGSTDQPQAKTGSGMGPVVLVIVTSRAEIVCLRYV